MLSRTITIATAMIASTTARSDPRADRPIATVVRAGVDVPAIELEPGEGTGAFVDLEVGWRFAHHGSIAVWGSYARNHSGGTDPGLYCDAGMTKPAGVDLDLDALAFGARGQVIAGEVSVGLGAGVDRTHAAGSDRCAGRVATWRSALPVVEGHVGYTIARDLRCAQCDLQIVVMANFAAELLGDMKSSIRVGLGWAVE